MLLTFQLNKFLRNAKYRSQNSFKIYYTAWKWYVMFALSQLHPCSLVVPFEQTSPSPARQTRKSLCILIINIAWQARIIKCANERKLYYMFMCHRILSAFNYLTYAQCKYNFGQKGSSDGFNVNIPIFSCLKIQEGRNIKKWLNGTCPKT